MPCNNIFLVFEWCALNMLIFNLLLRRSHSVSNSWLTSVLALVHNDPILVSFWSFWAITRNTKKLKKCIKSRIFMIILLLFNVNRLHLLIPRFWNTCKMKHVLFFNASYSYAVSMILCTTFVICKYVYIHSIKAVPKFWHQPDTIYL